MLLPRALAAALLLCRALAADSPPAAQATAEQDFELPDAGQEVPVANAGEAEVMSSQQKLEKGGLVEEWDKHMESFVPELLLTFPLNPRTDEYFYEDVTPPVLIRGGFFASSKEETSSVDFQVTDPAGDVIFEKTDEAEGLFHFLARKKGTYTFIVSNHKWMQQKMVTFAIGKGNETTLQTEHLDTIDAHMQVIDRTLKDIQTESTYLWIRQKSHMKTVESIHRRVFWFCVVEFLILVGISGFQVYYIKGLLSDRRVL
jgi:hypothetical protein